MTAALTTFLVNQLGTLLIEETKQKVKLVKGVRDEVNKLQNTFITIQEVLNDAEEKQFKDNSVKQWLVQFKDVAYDMEDVLDEWQTMIHMRSHIKENKVPSLVLFPFNEVTLRYNIASRIKALRIKLDGICDEQNKFKFAKTKAIVSEENVVPKERETSRVVLDTLKILPRDSEKEFIVRKLIGESIGSSSSTQPENEASDHHIISITGMGGIGKTTLAQLIINDNKVQTHFQKTIWVCVSEPFDRKRIAKAIIYQVSEKLPTSSEWDDLHVCMKDSFKGKQFLLVLDDVWTDDRDDLAPFKDLLHHEANGSRIMLTTRKESVVKEMNSYRYPLELLSSQNCCKLLSSIAFEGMGIKENENLKDIAMKITEKCGRLPLAAKILGSLMKKKQNERQWNDILNSEIWELKNVKDELFKPLLLSYNDLLSPLKRCFSYCVIFPKDHQIKKQVLIRIWMAQGFLNSPKVDPFLVGEDYFDDLAECSLFQDFLKNDDGAIISCKMHDIVHDFVLSLMENELCMKLTSDKPLLNDKSRHLTLTLSNGHELESCASQVSIPEAKNLRSLLISVDSYDRQSVPSRLDSHFNLSSHLRCVRVLKLKKMKIKQIPEEIEKLIHLRYLDLSHNKSLNELPVSVSSLYNLQTLKLKGCSGVTKLPRGVWGMINFKHLDIRGTPVELILPEGRGKFGRHCILSNGISRTDHLYVEGSSEGCNLKELKDLNLLHGCIDIRGLGRLRIAKEASSSKVVNNNKLKKNKGLCGCLKYTDDDDEEMVISPTSSTTTQGRVAENLDDSLKLVVEMTNGLFGVLTQSQTDINVLIVTEYLGLKLTSWIPSLTHLRDLKLMNISNCTELPTLGLLPSLQSLSISRLNNVVHVGPELYGVCNGTSIGGSDDKNVNLITFPKLESLNINYMEELEEIDLGVNDLEGDHHHIVVTIMPRLKKIDISECPKLKAIRDLSKLQSLEHLELFNLDKLEELSFSTVDSQIIMPSLLSFGITLCPKLKSLQQLLHLPKLKKLEIFHSRSAFQLLTAPNLTSLSILSSTIPSASLQLARFPKLEHLNLNGCNFSKSIREDIRHLAALQTLEIEDCDWPPEINPDCIEEDEEAWSIMSHIPKITIKREHKYELISTLAPTGTRQHSYKALC